MYIRGFVYTRWCVQINSAEVYISSVQSGFGKKHVVRDLLYRFEDLTRGQIYISAGLYIYIGTLEMAWDC